jgi:hypothetical protein
MFATLNNDVATLKNDGLQLLPPATTRATGKTRPAWCQNWRMFATLNNDVATLKNDGLQLLPSPTTPVASTEDLPTSAHLVNS